MGKPQFTVDTRWDLLADNNDSLRIVSSLLSRNYLSSFTPRHLTSLNDILCFISSSIPESEIMSRHLKTLAKAYPSTKFVSIRGDMCIANYPDKNIPTLLIYRKGQLVKQVVGMGGDVELKGMRTSVLGELLYHPFSHPTTSPHSAWINVNVVELILILSLFALQSVLCGSMQEDLEALLIICDAIDPFLKVAPTQEARRGSDDEGDSESERRNGRSQGIRRTTVARDDSDDDDLDL